MARLADTAWQKAVIASLWVCLSGILPTLAQDGMKTNTGVPDFSSNQAGWVGIGAGFRPVPGRLPPVTNDPAHPLVPNGTSAQPTYPIADLSNPNLRPWVKELMKKDNDEVLAGKIAYTARSSCMPAGVPGFMAYGGPTPLYFVQTPKEILMIFSGDHHPDAFYEPWSGMRRYRRIEGWMDEDVCAENNQHLFDYHIPVADKPDF